jgi:ribosomal protein S18 acetylase RimI-like enzyme
LTIDCAPAPTTAALRDELRSIYRDTWPRTYETILTEDILARMLRSLDEPGLPALLGDDDERILLARSASHADAVGAAILRVMEAPWGERVAVVWGFYIRPAWQRQGIGSALLEAIEAEASGAERISLAVLEANTGTLAFYERLGFTRQLSRVSEILPGIEAPVIELTKPLPNQATPTP